MLQGMFWKGARDMKDARKKDGNVSVTSTDAVLEDETSSGEGFGSEEHGSETVSVPADMNIGTERVAPPEADDETDGTATTSSVQQQQHAEDEYNSSSVREDGDSEDRELTAFDEHGHGARRRRIVAVVLASIAAVAVIVTATMFAQFGAFAGESASSEQQSAAEDADGFAVETGGGSEAAEDGSASSAVSDEANEALAGVGETVAASAADALSAYEEEQAERAAAAQAEAERIAAEEAAVASQAQQSHGNVGGASGGSYASNGMSPGTISVGGNIIGYTSSYGATEAPSGCAGIWRGNDSTTDGSYCYFIGHNPGVFSVVAGLGYGSAVTVCDWNGNARTYHVCDIIDVTPYDYWENYMARITGYGESAVLQTCVGNGYRIFVAA